MPISNLCVERKLWNSTSNSSFFACSSCARVESFQSMFSRNFVLDSSSFVGSRVTRSCKACNSLRTRFCIGVCVRQDFLDIPEWETTIFWNFVAFYWSWSGYWHYGLPDLGHCVISPRLTLDRPVWQISSVPVSWLRNWQYVIPSWVHRGDPWNYSLVLGYCL